MLVVEPFAGSLLVKARPATEGTRRFVYVEASNEAVDQQNEVVTQQALRDSADFFLKFGNLDIDHITLIGPRQGVPDHQFYEIGIPLDVRFDGPRTFVKAEIYRGSGPAVARADAFWESLTSLSPPGRWYASVGGSTLSRSSQIDADTGREIVAITRVRWSNLALSRTPVNQNVPVVSRVPIGPFRRK